MYGSHQTYSLKHIKNEIHLSCCLLRWNAVLLADAKMTWLLLQRPVFIEPQH